MDYISFIKGSKKKATLRLGVIVKQANTGRVVYAHNEKVYDKETSAREEYRAIMLAVKSVPMGSRITIYTNNLTAVNVFSGIWKAKKHTDIVDEFLRNSDMKDVKVLYACDNPNEEVIQGMQEAEMVCFR